ncbi:YfdQ family protein [Aliamphritea ceti]|uniref:YfdQ family protein n=1 Tax=Aliamphritea ceti TaxID=1524258 RepID=UPI0021C3BEA2|nr:YfdQ family protein [Aliamphritea ceti]
MSMDQSAIKEIQKSATLQHATQQLTQTLTPLAVLPDDFKIESLETYLNGRVRFRGNFETQSITDIADYIDDRHPSVFVNADKMTAKAIFNFGTDEAPGHCDNTATLALERNSAFSALLSINGRKLSQKDLAEWLEDWNEHAKVFDQEDEEMSIVAAIAAIRRITITAKSESTHSEHNFGAARSAMEEIEAKAEERMPSGFTFACVPYESLDERTFTARFSVLTGHDKPVLSVRIVQLESQEEDMGSEFKTKLTDALADDIAIYLGSFKAGH